MSATVDLQTSPVVLYGTGSFSLSVARALETLGNRPVALVDHTAERQHAFSQDFGMVVESPASAMARIANATVVLGIFNGYADVHAIGKSLVEMGASSVVTAVQFYDAMQQHGVLMPERYWLASNASWRVPPLESLEAHQVDQVRCLLRDQRSLSIFDGILDWRETGNWYESPLPDPIESAYSPDDLKMPRDNVRFVDVGAYSGDSIRALLKRGFSFSRVIAFEPDPGSFSRLATYMRDGLIPGEALPLALSDEHQLMAFNAAADSSSHLLDTGELQVPCVPLDDVLINTGVDYIKMDIEGAEMAALKGMTRIIRDQAPTLAVCVYHRPHDLWAVPLWLANLQPRYDFHLRVYCHQGFELVLYAIPS